MRLLVSLGLVVLLVCSWFTLISDTKKVHDAYQSQVDLARENLGAGLYEIALEHYNEAMAQRDSIELRDEMAQVYKTYASTMVYEAFCEDMVADFPLEVKGYEHLVVLYRDTQALDTCFNYIETAGKRGLQSDLIDAVAKELEYAYKLGRSAAVAVSAYSANICAVQYKSGQWSYVNTRGASVTGSYYLSAQPFDAAGLALVQLLDGRYALIDTTGKHISLSPETLKIEHCTPYMGNKMAVKYDGKYHYCDASFTELFGAYDAAGSFNGGVAAVMEGKKWGVINENGEKVVDFIYDDVKLDEKGIAFRGDRAFVKQNGEYILIDSTGKRIGNEAWDDADVFNSDMIAAVQKNGKWAFIDAEGKVLTEFVYTEAKSFSNGMAAVKIDEQWGYIRTDDYKVVIEPVFSEANDFSASGTAFVREGETWRLLRIYRLT